MLLNAEPLFAFAIALVVWVAAEIKTSEEVVLRNSSPNDVRQARRLLGYHAEQFRIFLKNHDFYSTIEARYLEEVNLLLHEYEVKIFSIQNKRLTLPLLELMDALKKVSQFLVQHTVPSRFGASWRTAFRNKTEILSEGDFAAERALTIEANQLATVAWEKLEALSYLLRKEVPEALEEPIDVIWATPDRRIGESL